jgi:L-histidine N-alpha-methyltransferase
MTKAVLHPRRDGAADATARNDGAALLTEVEMRGESAAEVAEAEAHREFAAEVARDLALRPKRLQPKYLYDALGSQLFEAICALPWYRITRAERRLLALHAAAMTDSIADLTAMIELGCGSGEKLALLAGGMRRRGRPLRVHLVDISPAALDLSARTLATVPHVSVVTHRASYDVGLRQAATSPLRHGATLVLFLGSNIGNFHPSEADAFFRAVRRALRPGDGFLVGADLVKTEPALLHAYDDPLGVTAAFDKNVLVRINRELGGNFELADFTHEARWNASESRVEMHLRCRRARQVTIPAAGITVAFESGETIWTESSYKYVPEAIAAQGEAAGFEYREQWIEADAGFAVTLFRVG